MPRKQRFKPTRKPKPTLEGPVERSPEQPLNHPTQEDSGLRLRVEDHHGERRSG